MKKKLGLFILLSIAVLGFFKISTVNSNSNHTLGPLGTLAAQDNFSSSIIHDYCLNTDLKTSDLEIFEVNYAVFNCGLDEQVIPLPILNPNSIKNILGIYSSIPFVEQDNNIFNPYSLNIDPAWLKNKPKGLLSEPLVVRYIYRVNDINILPNNIDIKNFSSKQLRANTIASSDNKSTVALSNKIKFELPKADQNDFKTLVKAYVQWISQNIAYPTDESMETASKYINLKTPDKTLEYKVGVCEDNAYLLKTLLNSQGIEAYITSGKAINELTYDSIYPSNFIPHATVSIKTPQGFFAVTPTIQDTKKTKKLIFRDGNTLMVSKSYQNIDVKTYPMFIESIESVAEYNKLNAAYVFTLENLKRFNH